MLEKQIRHCNAEECPVDFKLLGKRYSECHYKHFPTAYPTFVNQDEECKYERRLLSSKE